MDLLTAAGDRPYLNNARWGWRRSRLLTQALRAPISTFDFLHAVLRRVVGLPMKGRDKTRYSSRSLECEQSGTLSLVPFRISRFCRRRSGGANPLGIGQGFVTPSSLCELQLPEQNAMRKCANLPEGLVQSLSLVLFLTWGEGLGLLENGLGCTLPESQQEGGLSVGAGGPQGASQWRDYPRRSVRARSFGP